MMVQQHAAPQLARNVYFPSDPQKILIGIGHGPYLWEEKVYMMVLSRNPKRFGLTCR